jgi:blue copper oxidase
VPVRTVRVMAPSNPLLHRRQLLLAGGAILLAACGKPGTNSTSVSRKTLAKADPVVPTAGFNELWIPPTLTGTNFDLAIAAASKQLHSGAATSTIGYNGAEFWGPTLIMTKGSNVKLNVTNNLAEETTAHWHGFHIPAEMDGGPHQVIAAGATWSPSFEVKNSAATYWYHPHMHTTTWPQMNHGAGGFIIVQDDAEATLALPRTYGVDDIPLMLTSRSFDGGNQFVLTAVTPYGDEMLTNGTLRAEVSLPAQFVRFRILNAEIERAYNLGFADGRTFHVIATDGGLVNTPVPVTRLVMLPGERYEVLVDLRGDAVGAPVAMQSFNSGQTFGFPGGEGAPSGATFGSALNNTTFDVLRINVVAATVNAVTALPTTLAETIYWTAADATNERTIAITDTGPGSPFTFDHVGYAMDTVAQTVVLDTVEAWTIQNGRTFGHSFHIHDVQFSIVSRSNGDVGEHERGWKDTVYVLKDQSVTFVAKFADFASTDHPYMYHCHMANHEDEGLMGQFVVVPS